MARGRKHKSLVIKGKKAAAMHAGKKGRKRGRKRGRKHSRK
jgi:hypothetical protein